MEPKLTPHPLDVIELQHLKTAGVFLCTMCSWWRGAGIDAAAWWVDPTGAGHRRVLITGETIEYRAPVVVADDTINATLVQSLLVEFLSIGGNGLEPQLTANWMTHFDQWFGFKDGDQSEANWIPIATGMHDKQPELEQSIYKFFSQHVPEFGLEP